MKLVISKALNYLYLGASRYRAVMADFFFRKITIIFLSLGLILNLGTWFLAITLNKALGENLAILHYNVIFGIDRIGVPITVYLIPIFSTAVLLINFLIGSALLHKNEIGPSQQLLVTSLIGNLILLVSMYLIYSINFS